MTTSARPIFIQNIGISAGNNELSPCGDVILKNHRADVGIGPYKGALYEQDDKLEFYAFFRLGSFFGIGGFSVLGGVISSNIINERFVEE